MALGMICGAVLGALTVLDLLIEAGGSLFAVASSRPGPPSEPTPPWAFLVLAAGAFGMPAASALIFGVRSKVPIAVAIVFDVVVLGATFAVVGPVKLFMALFVLIHLIAGVSLAMGSRPRDWTSPGESPAGTSGVDAPVESPPLVRTSGPEKNSRDSADNSTPDR